MSYGENSVTKSRRISDITRGPTVNEFNYRAELQRKLIGKALPSRSMVGIDVLGLLFELCTRNHSLLTFIFLIGN